MGSEKLAIIYIHRMLLAIKSHTHVDDDNSRHPSTTHMHAIKYIFNHRIAHIVLHAKYYTYKSTHYRWWRQRKTISTSDFKRTYYVVSFFSVHCLSDNEKKNAVFPIFIDRRYSQLLR